MDLARLGIEVTSDSVKTADTRLRRLPSAANDAERSIGRLEKSSAGVGSAMRGAVVQLAAFAGAAVSVRKALAAADEYSNMQNRLLALGASHEQAASQIAQLGEIARNTRAPLDATASLYTRLALTSDSLGASQQQLMQFTETVGLALAASGTSAGQAQGALTQLSQAMAGGVVRAEEFNSIMEGAPGLLIAVANGIEGVDGDIGKLRQMMLDGSLTSEAFFNGMLSQSEALRASFENTSPTISQALTVLNDSFTLFVGGADQATGVTTAIAEAMLVLAANMDVAIPVFGAVGIAIAAIAAPISVALLAVGGLAVGVITHWDEIKAAFQAGVDYFKALPAKLQGVMLDLALSIARGIDNLQASFEAGVQYVRDFAGNLLEALKQVARDALEAAMNIGGYIIDGIKQGINRKWEELKSRIEELGVALPDWLRRMLGIASPSKVFAEIGRWSVEGLVVGIDDNAAKAIDRARQLGTEIGTGVRDGLEPVLATMFDGLVRGDIRGLGNNLLSMGQNSFSGLLQSAFKVGGGGLASVGQGLGKAITGIGTALKTGVGIFGKLGGAISAAMPLIGAVSAAFSFFKKSTVNLDAGLKVAGRGMEEIVAQTYRLDEVTRFWGLSKKKKTRYDAADASISDPIQATINSIGERVLGLSEVLGLAGENLAKTTFEFELSTKGLSDEQIQEAIAAEMTRVGDTFADAVIGSYTEYLPDTAEIERLDKEIAKLGDFRGITDYKKAALEQQQVAAETAIEVVHLNEEFAALQREGEGSLEMLERLVGDLGAVNDALYLFDRTALEVSVTGAAAASALVELSGGLDQFTAKTQYAFDNLLTSAEQQARLTEIALDQLNSTFGDLGLAIPQTHDGFMALLDAQDLMTDQGRETYAALQNVAAAFVQVNGTAQQAADAAQEAALALEQAAAAAEAAEAEALAATMERAQAQWARAHEWNLTDYESVINDQIDLLRGGFEDLATSLRDQINLAADAVRSAERALDDITNAIGRRTPDETASATQARTDAAVTALARAVDRGVLPEAEVLGRILSDIGDTPEAFATREDYLRNFYQTNAVLSEAQAIAENTLSVEERMLAALEARLEQAASQADASIATLQEQLDVMRNLPAALSGVLPTGELSEDALNAMYTAVDAMQLTGLAAEINNLYLATLDRNSDLVGLNTYIRAVTDGSMSLADVATDLNNSIEAILGLTPGFEDTQTNRILAQIQDQIDMDQDRGTALLRLLADQHGENIVYISRQLAAILALPESLSGVIPTGQLNNDGTNVMFTDADVAQFTGVAAQINDLFNEYLGRNVALTGLNYYMNQLATGIATLAQIENEIANSYEAQTGQNSFNTGGGSSSGGGSSGGGATIVPPVVEIPTPTASGGLAAAVEAAYNAAFGMAPPSGSLGTWQREFDKGMSISDIVSRIFGFAGMSVPSSFPSYAVGTDFHPGGPAFVHSNELLNLPRGTSVSTRAETRRMFDNSEVVAEIKAMRKERKEDAEKIIKLEMENRRNLKTIAELQELNEAIGPKPTRTTQTVKDEVTA